MGRWSWFVLFGLATVLYPKSSAASPNDVRVGHISRLQVDGAPRVTLTAEVSCPAEPRDCETNLRWTIPSANEARNAVLMLREGRVHSIALNGVPFEGRVDEEEEIVRVDLVLPAGDEPLELEIRATVPLIYAGARCGFGMSYSLAEQRHRSTHRAAVHVDLDAKGLEGGRQSDNEENAVDPPAVEYEQPPQVSLTVPRAWKLSRRVWSVHRRHREQVATANSVGALHLYAENHRIIHGPVVGIGARIHDKDVRPWLRGGWEFSVAPWMLHTLALESDLRRITVVPSTEFGLPGWLIFPAVALGVGIPVRVLPEVRTGARVWGGLNFPLVGVVGGYDVFGPRGDAPIEHIGHIGLQFSL